MVRQKRQTDRVEAFSDGVFAIAITLLVLEIKVPEHAAVEQRGLGYALAALWPHYLAFVTSFLTILVIWVKHHWMFSLLQRSDHPLLYWNGLLLLFVTFLPFPTALLAEHLLFSGGKLASSVYTGTVLAISLAFKCLWWYATKNNRLFVNTGIGSNIAEAKQISQQYRYGPPLYLTAFGVSFISEGASIALCLFLALFFALQDWLMKA